MFGIDFSEILLIAIVALVVLGPERLPKVARTLGYLYGRFQRYMAQVKAEVGQEMAFEELRKFQSQMQEAAQSARYALHEEAAAIHGALSPGDDPKAVDPPGETGAEAVPELAHESAEPSPQLELDLGGQAPHPQAPDAAVKKL
ncbi:MAG: Sec-independent protein translocase protein TatB [Betaproteobacteria bacterium]|nr:Sec-independent protein translocase protein TatB [Betaproteobacteria bacterium]